MVAAILLAVLVFVWAPNAEAHPRLSQLEEMNRQTRPLRLLGPAKPLKLLAEYPVPSTKRVSWHNEKSLRRVNYQPDPVEDREAPLRVHRLDVSAYTSRPEETDDTPFQTASLKHVQWGFVASNKFPCGTRIRIPDLFGDEEFVVEDRMNPRYQQRVDVWMPRHGMARKFGVQKKAVIEVIEYGNRRYCHS